MKSLKLDDFPKKFYYSKASILNRRVAFKKKPMVFMLLVGISLEKGKVSRVWRVPDVSRPDEENGGHHYKEFYSDKEALVYMVNELGEANIERKKLMPRRDLVTTMLVGDETKEYTVNKYH